MSNLKFLAKSFAATFEAMVKGDDAAVLAQKLLRKGDSALTAQIAVRNGKKIDLEDAIVTAKENLQNALVNNGNSSFDRDNYSQRLVDCKNRIIQAEEALKSHNETTDFLADCLKDITTA